jgi:hypothetical protein
VLKSCKIDEKKSNERLEMKKKMENKDMKRQAV